MVRYEIRRWCEAEGIPLGYQSELESLVIQLVEVMRANPQLPLAFAEAAWREARFRRWELPLRDPEFQRQYMEAQK